MLSVMGGFPTGVLQVTWQRLLKDDSVETLATYSKKFGRQVNEPYLGKVVFTEASLSSSTITVKNVTWVDDSCYICSFNVYPDGSQRKQTCLTVQGKFSKDPLETHSVITLTIQQHLTLFSAPKWTSEQIENFFLILCQGIAEVETAADASIRVHDEEDVEVVFSCSATGKPAPTIQWNFSTGAFPLIQPQTTTATNSDFTFTSSRNISLQVPPDWNGHVDCLLNAGLMGERLERIPFHSDPGGKKKDTGMYV